MNDPTNILEEIYESALKEFEKDKGRSFLLKLTVSQRKSLIGLTNKCESFKAVITVVATSLTKKILDPKQDIRLHKIELRGGYSGRTFDTKYITPFFKKKFPRMAMKESGWLTRSLEQVAPFDLKFPGKIRDATVKKAFLSILNDIEMSKVNVKDYLTTLFILLINRNYFQTFRIKHIKNIKSITINLIIESLKQHFFQKYTVSGASRLPVLALYSIYVLLVRDLKRYEGKKLLPLKSHVASDIKSRDIGDITVVNIDGSFFEGVEVKHGIQIDDIMINDAFEKLKNTPTERYYLLTTAEPNIKFGEEEKIKQNIERIRKLHGCEIIVNGLVNSLKYYLRLLVNPSEFIEVYTKNLEEDFKKTTEIKEQHILAWKRIIKINFS